MGAGVDNSSLVSGSAAAARRWRAPAIADPDAGRRVERLTSSFVSALDLIYGGAETLAKALADLTDGHFTMKVSPAGEIAPGGRGARRGRRRQGRMRAYRALL